MNRRTIPALIIAAGLTLVGGVSAALADTTPTSDPMIVLWLGRRP